jgi:hypothetical protein
MSARLTEGLLVLSSTRRHITNPWRWARRFPTGTSLPSKDAKPVAGLALAMQPIHPALVFTQLDATAGTVGTLDS